MFNLNESVKIKGTNLVGAIQRITYNKGEKEFTVFIPPKEYRKLKDHQLEKRTEADG